MQSEFGRLIEIDAANFVLTNAILSIVEKIIIKFANRKLNYR